MYRLRQPLNKHDIDSVIKVAESNKDVYLMLAAEKIADSLRRGDANPEITQDFLDKSWLMGAAVADARIMLEDREKKTKESAQREKNAKPKGEPSGKKDNKYWAKRRREQG